MIYKVNLPSFSNSPTMTKMLLKHFRKNLPKLNQKWMHYHKSMERYKETMKVFLILLQVIKLSTKS